MYPSLPLIALLAFTLVLGVQAAPQFSSSNEKYAVLMDMRTGLPVPQGKRDDSPSAHDLLSSCPTAGGSARTEKRLVTADTCVWSKTRDTSGIYVTRKYLYQGDTMLGFQSNCDPSVTTPRVFTVTGGTYFAAWFGVSSSVGLDLGPFSIGFSTETGRYTIIVKSDHSRLVINPGQKGAIVSFANMINSVGTVQINYPKRQAHHYTWFVYNVAARLPVGSASTGPIIIDCNKPTPNIQQ